jgi:hypothetical protein
MRTDQSGESTPRTRITQVAGSCNVIGNPVLLMTAFRRFPTNSRRTTTRSVPAASDWLG